MAFVDVQDRPGGFDFLDATGARTPAFESPYTRQLAEQIRASRPPDQRTAMAPFGSVESMQSEMTDAPPAPVPGVAAGPPPPPPVAPVVEPTAAPRSVPGPAPTRDQAFRDTQDIVLADAMQRRQVYSPGRAAFDPAAADAARKAVRTGEVRAGGLPLTEDEETDLRLSRWKEREAQDKLEVAAFNNIAEAEREKFVAIEEAKRREADVAAQKQALADREATFRAESAKLQGEIDAVRSEKIDPNRVFADGGAFAQIASGIAQAMGAYGASLGGGPNYAAQMINGIIDRDIAAQRDSIDRRGAAADTALGRLMSRYGMDRSEATEALRSAQLAAAEARASRSRAVAAPGAAQEAAAKLEAEIARMRQESTVRLAELTRGRTTVQATYMDPQRATGGGMRPETDAEYYRRLKLAGEGVQSIGEATGIGPNARKEQREERKDMDTRLAEYGKRRAASQELLSSLDQLTRASGGTVAPSGESRWEEGADVVGVGRFDSRSPDLTVPAKRFTGALKMTEATIGKWLSGATVSEEQMEAIQAKLNSADEDVFKQGIADFKQAIAEDRANHDAAFGADVVTQYERQRVDTARARKQIADAEPVERVLR